MPIWSQTCQRFPDPASLARDRGLPKKPFFSWHAAAIRQSGSCRNQRRSWLKVWTRCADGLTFCAPAGTVRGLRGSVFGRQIVGSGNPSMKKHTMTSERFCYLFFPLFIGHSAQHRWFQLVRRGAFHILLTAPTRTSQAGGQTWGAASQSCSVSRGKCRNITKSCTDIHFNHMWTRFVLFCFVLKTQFIIQFHVPRISRRLWRFSLKKCTHAFNFRHRRGAAVFSLLNISFLFLEKLPRIVSGEFPPAPTPCVCVCVRSTWWRDFAK